jgi:hypothetical protein
MPSARTHYDTLNVSPDAESVVIEAAYRALMKRYHPDQGDAAPAGAPSAAAINEAYAVLRDPARRADYDRVEWIRQKDFRIAQYNATVVAPPSRFFGWGGWLVAAVLAAMIAVMASRGVDPPLPGLSRAEPPAPAPSALDSQPRRPDERVMRAAEEAAKVDARVTELIARSNPPPPPLAAAEAPPARRYAAPRSRARPNRAASARERREKDFLERQGGIY